MQIKTVILGVLMSNKANQLSGNLNFNSDYSKEIRKNYEKEYAIKKTQHSGTCTRFIPWFGSDDGGSSSSSSSSASTSSSNTSSAATSATATPTPEQVEVEDDTNVEEFAGFTVNYDDVAEWITYGTIGVSTADELLIWAMNGNTS